MKQSGVLFGAILAVLLILSGCAEQPNVIREAIPEMHKVLVNGDYNGGMLKSWSLERSEIEGLNAWIDQLLLKHRTYGEGEAPNEKWVGGTSYQFVINDGEFSFAYVYIDRAYIWLDGEWYEITRSTKPPLGLRI